MIDRRGEVAAGEAIGIGVVVMLVHAAVFCTVVLAFHISVEHYSDKGDGLSYKHMAAALLGDRGALDDYDSRVFPGYPALIAALHVVSRLSLSASALAVTFIAAGAGAAMAAMVFGDVRVGWAVGLLLPHAWINMSMAMSEAPLLALELAGLLLARRNRTTTAGFVFGLAGLTRPVACFALVGLIFRQWARGQGRQSAATAIIAGLVVAIGMVLLRFATGESLRGVHEYINSPRAYDGRIFTWPFRSILWMTLYGHVSVGRWIYIIAHVAAAIGGCAILARKNSRMDALAFPWLTLNTLFILCVGLGPGGWGFNHFPRFMIPALPPLAWSWRKFLPARAWLYIPLCAVFFAMALYGVRDCP